MYGDIKKTLFLIQWIQISYSFYYTRFLDSFQKKWRLFTVKEIWHFAQKIHATVHTYLVTMHIYEEKMQTKIQLYTLIHIKFCVYTKPQERNVSLFIIPRLPLQLYVKSLSWSRAMLHLGQHFDYHHRCKVTAKA